MRTASNSAPLDLSGRIPGLDCIRGIAIGMILFFHYFFQAIDALDGSFLSRLQSVTRLTWRGVDTFSSYFRFLIGCILPNTRDSSNYFRVFYIRRFCRMPRGKGRLWLKCPSNRTSALIVKRFNLV